MGVVSVLLAGMVIGCSDAPDPVTVDVGVHRVSFMVPEGWQHYDHGREQRLETTDGDIVLTDLGPVAAEGYRAVILRARELYRKGQHEDARQLLENLDREPPITSPVVRSALDENFGVGWADRPTREVERAFATVVASLEQLPEPDLDSLATAFLADFDHGPRRDIERRERRNLDGRPARQIVTWQRLTHDHRRWHVFVINRGNVLVIRSEVGLDTVLGPAIENVVRSLVFVETGAHRP